MTGTPSIETLLAPLDHLEPQPRIGDVESRLRVVAASLNGIDPLRREAVKSGATSKLKAVKVSGAKQLVDAALSGDGKATPGQGTAFEFEEPDPWPDPVPGAELLDMLDRCYGDHVILPTGGAIALALWTVHTYAVAAANTSPYLVLTSPEPRCGKTTAIAIASALCYRPLPSSNISEAALYRLVEQAEPTLIIDEADTFLRDNYAFSGILNSGHSRTTAFAVRCVGDNAEPRRFKTFGPKLIALIGRLPAASTADRSILVRMRRRLPGEPVKRADTRRLYADLADIRRRITRWVQDALPSLRTAEPAMPPTLDDRAADNWCPLLALADAAGGRWPTLAREMAVLLSRERAEESGFGVALLEDIRTLFGTCRVVASDVMLEGLVGLSERSWATLTKHGKPMTQRHLATMLRPFGIRPGTVRIGEVTCKGYTLADFEDSFARYIPDFLSVTPSHVNDDAPLGGNTHPSHSGDVTDSAVEISADEGVRIRNCDGVTDRKPETGEATIYDL
jgi:putative DNA primase/helicase